MIRENNVNLLPYGCYIIFFPILIVNVIYYRIIININFLKGSAIITIFWWYRDVFVKTKKLILAH